MHVISKAQEQHKNVELHVVNFVVVVVVVIMVDFNFVGSLFLCLAKMILLLMKGVQCQSVSKILH